MGIEKYFQVGGGGASTSKTKKESATETKPKSTPKAKPTSSASTTRKKKIIIEDEDDDMEEDFQAPVVKSKHFGSSSSSAAATVKKPVTKEETKVDPKAFFGSKKTSVSSPSATVKKEVLTAKAATIIPTKSSTPIKSTRKAAPKDSYVLSDSDDNDDDDGDMYIEEKAAVKDEQSDIEMMDAPPPSKAAGKKAKRDVSFDEEEPKKATITTSATRKKSTTAVSKKTTAAKKELEEEEEEKPKKKNNFYQKMKNQEPPKALGSRPEPQGASNCLQNKTFVISGQFETLTREQTKDIIMRYGGRVTGQVSSKTTYLCLGRDAGESKSAKAKNFGTKVLDEDEFYELVESSAPQKVEFVAPPVPKASGKGKSKASEPVLSSTLPSEEDYKKQLWTEKYKPQTVNEIIGNKDLVQRINDWLANWQDNYHKGFEGEGDNLNNWRSLILSGPPGIGKTTTAQVVARTNGFEPIELNASDVRSKKILEASISEMMDNHTMTEYFQAAAAVTTKTAEQKLIQGKRVVLIMDEVDGMSAGDRGGAVELAGLIRKSKIPVICICNDSRSQKVAPLLRVCYEAKFKRTPANQIRSKILNIAFKEHLALQPNAVDELVAATHNDIRQIINILSTYRLKEGSMNYDQAKTVGKNNEKYSILGLFEIPIELLSGQRWRDKNLTQKYEVYFHDYNFAHLMIWENYLRSISPERAKSFDGNPVLEQVNEMDLIAKAADAMADGDLVDGMIHGTVQHWSLMPVHSIMSCVIPASYMKGAIRGKMMFPSWLGQNSKAGKYGRALADIQTRMRLKASGDKFEIRQNYIPTLNDRIFGELQKEHLDEAMEYMDDYYLDRENLDTLSDLTFSTTKAKTPLSSVPTKTKTSFTRLYNAKNHPILFQLSGVPIKKAAGTSPPKEDAGDTVIAEEEDTSFGDDVSEEEEEDNKEDDPEQDLQNIKYIKESTKKRKAPASTTKATPSGSQAKKLKSKK